MKTEFGLRAGRSSNTPRAGVIALERDVARTNVDLYLARGLTVTGRVTRHDGAPVPGARVMALPAREESSDDPSMPPGAFGRTNAQGEYVLPNLPEGLYQISAVTEGDSRMRGNTLRPLPRHHSRGGRGRRESVEDGRREQYRHRVSGVRALAISGTIVHSDGATGTEAFLQAGRETYPWSSRQTARLPA